MKQNFYLTQLKQFYFWRVYTGGEIDLVEVKDNSVAAWEFKWSNKTGKPPKSWTENYPQASYDTINSMNWHHWTRQ